MMILNAQEKKIMKVLYLANKPLSTKEISERAELSWPTTKKYLDEMHKKNYVDGGIKGNSVFWWIKY
ncbi:hypothetical protein MsAg5_11380 [Methanosarcinaceae archaeon Ag5]|uniref:Uncharacterized protein n=1 Tax=Methanolapillus africanus TaxID=3028297 RepID=A0AAE4MJV1_9EURY|nr:hypothetical protein [Methanosarcinaceae archaeon Ag5]